MSAAGVRPVPKFKLWLEVNGKAVMGRGRVELLTNVRKYGSLSEAAKRSGMSYRHAYDLVQSLNRRCGVKIIEPAVGGAKGGGMGLTKAGERLVDGYLSLKKELESHIKAHNGKKRAGGKQSKRNSRCSGR